MAGRPCAGPGSHLALPHGQLVGCFARGDHFIAKCIVDVVLSSRRGELLHQSGGEFGELKHGSGCVASAAVGDRSALEIAASMTSGRLPRRLVRTPLAVS